MKLWEKGGSTDRYAEDFTTGRDPEMDVFLAEFDILGTIAHVTMLRSIDIISEEEFRNLKKELIRIHGEAQKGLFRIEEGTEDVHSQLENMLTRNLGEPGRKVHTGRSRNDQVLVDLHMFVRDRIQQTVDLSRKLFETLCKLSEKHTRTGMPGYTHFQVAMPSSFGLWFASFAEDLCDDMIMLEAAYRFASQNPLGSAAGYGSSVPINRHMTTELLGFDALRYNVMHAMMSRGRLEKIAAQALSSLAGTLSRLAMDVCIYMGQNFRFITLSDEFTTGSSIMPHKKNPDVFELVRGKCNALRSLGYETELVTANLPSGYHRDYQVLKESLLPAFDVVWDCLMITDHALGHIEVRENILDDAVYQYITSVDRINQLVMEGKPFREAYLEIARQIEGGTFKPATGTEHKHEGSLGNLCLEKIREKMNGRIKAFRFEKAEKAIQKLLKE